MRPVGRRSQNGPRLGARSTHQLQAAPDARSLALNRNALPGQQPTGDGHAARTERVAIIGSVLCVLRARGGVGKGYFAFVPTPDLIGVYDDPARRTVGSGAVFGSDFAASFALALGHLA